MSQEKLHNTLSQTYDAKYPEMIPPAKCYPNERFNKDLIFGNSSSTSTDNCQLSSFPKLAKFAKGSHSQTNTELSVLGKKCMATTTSTTSSSFANFIWHKSSTNVEDNRNCTFICYTSTSSDKDTSRMQQPDVLDLSVLKTEKVDDHESYEDSNSYNPALYDQFNMKEQFSSH